MRIIIQEEFFKWLENHPEDWQRNYYENNY